ncbi:ABC transporter substrate-binding protein [Planctomycetota bacterium]
MKKGILLLIAVVVFFGGTFLLKMSIHKEPHVQAAPKEVNRIVSLAPSITETLYLLGLEKKLVGVTIYCEYPPEAKTIDKIGGYSTPNFERIAVLKPDLIIMVEEHKKLDFNRKFGDLGMATLFVSAQTIQDILNSIIVIGKECGAPEKAEAIVKEMTEKVESIKALRTKKQPLVLISVGKNMGSTGLDSVFAAGKKTYYNDLLSIAGARNACPETPQKYVNLSGEGILLSNPDIIIDIVPEADEKKVEYVKKTWKAIPGLSARITVFAGEYASRPGPSFVRVLEDISREIEIWRKSIR